METIKKARVGEHAGIPASPASFTNPLLKRIQQPEEQPEEEGRAPQKKIMYVPPPTKFEPLIMATRRANIVQLLRENGYIGRHLTPLELQAAYNI